MIEQNYICKYLVQLGEKKKKTKTKTKARQALSSYYEKKKKNLYLVKKRPIES